MSAKEIVGDAASSTAEPLGRWRPSLGAWPEDGGARFRVWAPEAKSVQVVAEGTKSHPLQRSDDGTFSGLIPGMTAGDLYRFRFDDQGPFPDPASRFQPLGVHGPSELIAPNRFPWTDAGWHGVEPDQVVVYELHVGTFSPAGTFAGVAERLPDLKELGVTVIELMPIADFAGARSWGYDGVDLYAPSRNYGRPDDLRRLVDEAHRVGIAVFLDVVYNHFGPVGNYAVAASPNYLSKTHSSAWAACVNLDGQGSEQVREFFIENACHWVHEYHVDGLRLDATHALIDDSAKPFVAELVDKVKSTVHDRQILIVAEDHRNWNTMIQPISQGGWGLDGIWADDLYHQIRRHLAGDHESYFRDFTGSVADIAETINHGWFYHGQRSLHHENEPRGTDASGLPPCSFYVCLQNHDQVGNRAMGDRLTATVDLAAYRAATTLLLCLPQTPLLFMGQEWGATTPFQYFTDHDPELGMVVTEGRRYEFRHFRAFQDPGSQATIPDPQDPATFERSRLDWSEAQREPHASTRRLYQALLQLRHNESALRSGAPDGFQATAVDDETLLLRRVKEEGATLWLVVRFQGGGTVNLDHFVELKTGGWETVLTTEDPPFAADAMPPKIGFDGVVPTIRFERAGAVLLRQWAVSTAILKG